MLLWENPRANYLWSTGMMTHQVAEPALHVEFPPNAMGRDFIVGDIHGDYDELFCRLWDHDFSGKRDRLFSVGDLIDRGPKSSEVVALTREPWFFTVQGNHEQMMLDGILGEKLSYWLANGGEWFLDVDAASLIDMVESILKWPLAITINHRSGKRLGICHAQPPVDHWEKIQTIEVDAQAFNEILWSRSRALYRDTSIVEGVDWIFCGHTPMEMPTVLGNTVFIDTGAFLPGGYLTVLNIDKFVEQGLSGPCLVQPDGAAGAACDGGYRP